MESPPACPLAHVALTVPDLAAAAEWYRKVLGFERLLPDAERVLADDDPAVGRIEAIFGPGARAFKVAHLATASGAALELFEWSDPAGEAGDGYRFWRTGLIHFAFVDPDPVACAERVRANGGTVKAEVAPALPGTEYTMCTCADPFGIVFDVISHPDQEVFGNG